MSGLVSRVMQLGACAVPGLEPHTWTVLRGLLLRAEGPAGVLEALREGRGYVAFEVSGSALGFRFAAFDAEGALVADLGEALPWRPGLSLRAAAPRAGWRPGCHTSRLSRGSRWAGAFFPRAGWGAGVCSGSRFLCGSSNSTDGDDALTVRTTNAFSLKVVCKCEDASAGTLCLNRHDAAFSLSPVLFEFRGTCTFCGH